MPVFKDSEIAGPAPTGPPPGADSSDKYNVYDDAKTYYSTVERHRNHRAGPRTRTYSQVGESGKV